jgi:uncharacterized protein YyaL (SSP411 family)
MSPWFRRVQLSLFALILAGCMENSHPSATQPAAPAPAALTGPVAAIHWVPWSDDAFAAAKRDHKLIILDLEAVWCHWCHVQDDTTYSDPAVQKLINDHFIAIKVDQDSRPDISNRYEDYGWPATILFDSDGKAIVKQRGYIPPMRMVSLLKATIADPTPGPSIQPKTKVQPATEPAMTTADRDELIGRLKSYYDDKNGGWGFVTKFMDADVIEYETLAARHGDKTADHRVRQTLDAAIKLIDPVWGGVDQYSIDGDWDHPHFEKIMSYQADDLRTYARSYAIFHDPAYLSAAQKIHHFLHTFLTSPDGAFYTSMDADRTPGVYAEAYFKLDDAQRRAHGLPQIDTHIYARENGWAIRALVSLSTETGDADAMNEATIAANWIIAHRSIVGGGFTHGGADAAGPYLGDTLAMGRAFLALYAATADRGWLVRADAAAGFIESHFLATDTAGVLTAVPHAGEPFAPGVEVDENSAVARFARLLFAYTGKPAHEKLAETAMKYIASPQIVAQRGWLVGGLLLADQDMTGDPVHIVIVGSKDDPNARALFSLAAAYPVSYKRVEWYDSREGPLMNNDVEYPPLKNAAAFLCVGTACSSPQSDPAKFAEKLNSMARIP